MQQTIPVPRTCKGSWRIKKRERLDLAFQTKLRIASPQLLEHQSHGTRSHTSAPRNPPTNAGLGPKQAPPPSQNAAASDHNRHIQSRGQRMIAHGGSGHFIRYSWNDSSKKVELLPQLRPVFRSVCSSRCTTQPSTSKSMHRQGRTG